MEATTHTSDLEAARDLQIVVDSVSAGRQIPPDVALRVQKRADEARKKLLATHGVQDSGVQIIREIRGELPTP
jgi:hypothetical protein